MDKSCNSKSKDKVAKLSGEAMEVVIEFGAKSSVQDKFAHNIVHFMICFGFINPALQMDLPSWYVKLINMFPPETLLIYSMKKIKLV